MSKKFFSIFCVLLMVVILSFSVVACNTGDSTGGDDNHNTEGGDSNGTPVYQVGEASSYVSLDINPEISLTVDENDYVVSVYGENEDGQVLLYEESGNIVGKDIETAIDKIVSLAVELGYLDENNKVVGTTVSTADEEDMQALLNKVNGKITATAQKSGLSVEIDPEGAFSMLRDLEELKAKYPTNQAIQSLTVSKFKLVSTATETGEISIEGAVELDDEELIEMISEKHEKMEAYATEAFQKAKSEAMAVYDKVAGMAEDAVYVAYYAENAMSHATTCYLGGVYQMYASTARGLDAIADSIAYVEKYSSYELTEAQVEGVMEVLEITDRTLIEDSESNVTIDSIEAYTDKIIKNMGESADYDAYKAEVKSTLEGLEATLKATAKTEADKYIPAIREYMASVEPMVNALDSYKTMPFIGTSVESYINDYQAIVAEVNAALDGVNLDVDALRASVEELKEKAEDILDLIEEDLSDEEEATIEARKKAAVDALSSAKQAFEDALDSAAQSAKDHIAGLRAQREDN
ncbi:MAG: hypothetical protein IJ033_02625 [Clostridia bacterium]|nr:hypothetical protein [Clostridia bacterium]